MVSNILETYNILIQNTMYEQVISLLSKLFLTLLDKLNNVSQLLASFYHSDPYLHTCTFEMRNSDKLILFDKHDNGGKAHGLDF